MKILENVYIKNFFWKYSWIQGRNEIDVKNLYVFKNSLNITNNIYNNISKFT